MTFRKFTTFFLWALIIFTAASFALWKLYTEKLLTTKYDGGELARLSYSPNSKLPRKNHLELPRRHFLWNESETARADLLTIGDSFSAGIGGGKNHFYQDYIASYSNIGVTNLHSYPTADAVVGASPLTTLILLYNSGLLDRIKPRYVLLQSIERYCVERFSHPYDFSQSLDQAELLKFYNGMKYNFETLPPLTFVNTGNARFLYVNLLYNFSDRAFGNYPYSVVIRKLKQPMFTARNKDKLLFVKGDVDAIKLATDEKMQALNENLNTMARLLAKKNIKLVFMPVVDKYDLYSDLVENNPYPKSVFFEKLRPLEKEYIFVDTKEILKGLVAKGEPDVFYPDDSHWSWKAPEAIFSQVRFP